MLTANDLSPGQVQSCRDILLKKRLCNTSGCGHGKTAGSLTAFVTLHKKYPNAKCLIVSNKKGVENAWSKEYKKWSHTKYLNVVVLTGSPKERLEKLNQDADVYVIIYNNLEWLSIHSKHKFNFIIADEGECLKGSSSKWRRMLIRLSQHASYRYVLTATPKSKDESDYWGIARYLDGGKRLGRTITDFRNEYMVSYVVNNRQLWRMNKTKIDILEDKIKDLFVDYGLSETADIPIKTITVYGRLTESSQKKYDILEKEQSLNSVLITDEYEPLDPLSVSTKLNQLSSGFLYADEKIRIDADTLEQTTNFKKLKKQKIIDVFPDRKLLFKQLVDKIHDKHGADQNIAIWYHFKHELTQLQSILPEGVSDVDDDIESRWNTNKIKYLFLQYGRSARALNLQKGGHITALYSSTFKWADDYQMVRRLARQGQPNECVYVYRLYIRDTLDDLKTKRIDERFQGHKRFQTLTRKKYL